MKRFPIILGPLLLLMTLVLYAQRTVTYNTNTLHVIAPTNISGVVIGGMVFSNLSGGTPGQVLVTDGSKVYWTNFPAGVTAYTNLTDVELSPRVDGETYRFDATSGKVTNNTPLTFSGTNASFTGNVTAVGFVGEAGGLTNTLPATNATQLVNLAQLEASSASGEHFYFDLGAPAAGFTLTGTVGTTNWAGTTVPAVVVTNTAATFADGTYAAAFLSTNTFTSIGSGLAEVDIYAFENSAGNGSVSAEVYLVNSVTMAEEYEFTPSPAFQAVPATATPTKLSFSVSTTDYTSTTNLYIMVKVKVSEASTPDPTIRIVSGGAYNSHVSFPVPLGQYVRKSGDTMTGTLTVPQLIGTSPTVTDSAPVLSLSQEWNDATEAFTGVLLNVTNTASTTNSMLQRWQVGGNDVASVRYDGRIYSTNRIEIDDLSGGTSTRLTGSTLENNASFSIKIDNDSNTANAQYVVRNGGNNAIFYAEELGDAYVPLGELTVTSGTTTADDPVISATQTFNSATTDFTAVRVNVTDTASTNTSKLLDLQVGSASKASVRKDGMGNLTSLFIQGTNTITAPSQFDAMGAHLWTDGTNLCVVLTDSAGTRTTNKLSMVAWP